MIPPIAYQGYDIWLKNCEKPNEMSRMKFHGNGMKNCTAAVTGNINARDRGDLS